MTTGGESFEEKSEGAVPLLTHSAASPGSTPPSGNIQQKGKPSWALTESSFEVSRFEEAIQSRSVQDFMLGRIFVSCMALSGGGGASGSGSGDESINSLLAAQALTLGLRLPHPSSSSSSSSSKGSHVDLDTIGNQTTRLFL